jgi:hypothetical protein
MARRTRVPLAAMDVFPELGRDGLDDGSRELIPSLLTGYYQNLVRNDGIFTFIVIYASF